MIEATYKKGDRVRHPSRPEWGIGVVSKIEVVTRGESTDLRVWVRFPSIGEKTLLASAAALEILDDQSFSSAVHSRPSVTDFDVAKGGGWLGSISKQSANDLMTTLPGEATDPFAHPKRRLEVTIKLYRFDGSPARLVEWSIAQSGLDDPMSRFNRQELEQLYKKWLFNLDAHLLKLLGEFRREKTLVDQALLNAPPLAVKAVRRQQGLLK
ncbi:hypothetical protein LBMAG51_08900 [Phycisphaerae bacterium]|nr:hypothetical protein LBMAG51_08900 [Phycisphaerae bacterium]